MSHLHLRPPGDYQARVTVTRGATGLKGTVQRLEGRYLLCGLEAMPAMIAKVVGVGSSLAGCLTTIVLLYRFAKGRRKVSESPDVAVKS